MRTHLIALAVVAAVLAAPAQAHSPGIVAPAWGGILKAKPGNSAKVGKRVCPFGIGRVRAYQSGRELRHERMKSSTGFKDGIGFKDANGDVVVAWSGRAFVVFDGTDNYIVSVWCRPI